MGGKSSLHGIRFPVHVAALPGLRSRRILSRYPLSVPQDLHLISSRDAGRTQILILRPASDLRFRHRNQYSDLEFNFRLWSSDSDTFRLDDDDGGDRFKLRRQSFNNKATDNTTASFFPFHRSVNVPMVVGMLTLQLVMACSGISGGGRQSACDIR